MSNFAALQSEVQGNISDLPTAVVNNIPLYINRAMRKLMELHSFNCMQGELGASDTLTTSPVTNQTPALLSQHYLGTVSGPDGNGSICKDWKEPRGLPFYQRQLGSASEFMWSPDRQMVYRQVDPRDPNAKGAPEYLLLSEPTDTFDTRTVEYYPFSDTNSDWTSAPAGEYRIHIPYYKFLPALVNSGDSNWFTENATQFLIDMATAYAFRANWDEARYQMWYGDAYVDKTSPTGRVVACSFRQAMLLDQGKTFPPSRVLAPRRDVYGPRDQYRT